jgi:hypothetical protein
MGCDRDAASPRGEMEVAGFSPEEAILVSLAPLGAYPGTRAAGDWRPGRSE